MLKQVGGYRLVGLFGLEENRPQGLLFGYRPVDILVVFEFLCRLNVLSRLVVVQASGLWLEAGLSNLTGFVE